MENERQPAGRRGLDDEHNSIELARGTNHEAINATVSMITRITTLFFFILLGCVYGFRFKRPPQLSSPLCWKDAHIFIGQHSTHRDTRCYAFDENDGRGRGRGRDGTGGRGRGRGTSNGRGYAGLNGGETKDSDALFLFDRNNDNPTQREVDAYFLSQPNPSPDEIVSILLCAVKWKKKKRIDVLSGDKLLVVMSALQDMLSKNILKPSTLRYATIGVLESLQVVPLADIEKSGLWCSFLKSLISNSHTS